MENGLNQPLVLIVEDEPALRSIYRIVMSKLDFAVLEARTGGEALELLAQHTPDLLFLDIHLPEIDGITVLEHIQEEPRLQHMRIIVITADQQIQEYTQNWPEIAFLIKPVLPEQIRKIVSDMRQ